MSSEQARRGRRRTNLAILLGTAMAVGALVGLLGLLLPQSQPTSRSLERPRVATCEQPQLATVPVPVTSGLVLQCPEVFDGRVVMVLGEAIGDLLRGPDGRRWVQVNDDAYADIGPLTSHQQPLGTNSGIPVLLPVDMTPSALGGPGVQGDLVEVIGTFWAASDEDQGGPAVIAHGVTIQREGVLLGLPASRRLRIATPVALAITLGLLAAVLRRRAAR